jgi:xanthine/uracil permease
MGSRGSLDTQTKGRSHPRNRLRCGYRRETLVVFILGLQNIFRMTVMFVFPAILGSSYSLAPHQIAYLYGMIFAICGVVTILRSALLLRLPMSRGRMPAALRACSPSVISL